MGRKENAFSFFSGDDATIYLLDDGQRNARFRGYHSKGRELRCQHDRLDALSEMLPEQVYYRRRNIPNLTKEAVRRFRGTAVGYYTFRFSYLLRTADGVFVCRFESLTQDLIGFFEAMGAATDELRDYVLRSDKKNTSEHLHTPPITYRSSQS